MIEQLFGSKTRVKIMKVFLDNPNKCFFVRELTRLTDSLINSVRRELDNLEKMGFVKVVDENLKSIPAEQKRGSGKNDTSKTSKKYFSFLDGPITANNPMGVHHAWGRTLKDLFQRYKAMQGFDQRYQNGFDCQGLWLEVETEKDLGFNSKKDIENFGLDKFSKACRERVEKFSKNLKITNFQ